MSTFIKKAIIALLLLFLTLPATAKVQAENKKPLEAEITFDWISKTQLQRDENISQIQNILFNDDTILKYPKKEFKSKYKEFLKNKNYLADYEEISNGKKEDAENYYCGFYWKNIFVVYGIQHKKDLNHIYYYDALGNLRWIDIFSSNYPDFPYWAYQYYANGKLGAAYYYISEYDQYIFTPNKKFKGRWYKENMYNKNAKVIMTRSNYGQKD